MARPDPVSPPGPSWFMVSLLTGCCCCCRTPTPPFIFISGHKTMLFAGFSTLCTDFLSLFLWVSDPSHGCVGCVRTAGTPIPAGSKTISGGGDPKFPEIFLIFFKIFTLILFTGDHRLFTIRVSLFWRQTSNQIHNSGWFPRDFLKRIDKWGYKAIS